MRNEIEKLIKDAEFSIGHYKREIVTYGLNLELTPDSSWDKGMLRTCTDNLAKAEYRLQRLTEKLADLDSKTLPESNEVTRFEVIDATGRVYCASGVTNAQVSYQDNGKTLKIFLT